MREMGRKFLVLCLAAVLTLALLPVPARAAVISSGYGSWGTWTVDDTGVLTIDGTGEIDDDTVANIPWFNERNIIQSINITPGITRIGMNAFYGCRNLTSATIPDSVTSIGDEAFSGCSSLTSITIPDSVTNIGASAFWNCTGLTSVTLPSSAAAIGDGAFTNCSSLTSLTIPEGITSIGVSAFSDCPLTSVTIPGSVVKIGNSAFARTNLTSLTISEGVVTIGDSAFTGCTSLTSVMIPESVTTIEDYAFSDCENLTSVMIHASITSNGGYIFLGCPKLQTLVCTGDRPKDLPEMFLNSSGAKYYPWDNETWGDDVGAAWTPFGKTELTVSKIPAEAPHEITVTSSVIPFKPEEAVKTENYTFDSTYTVTAAAVSGDSMTVTLTLQESESGLAAQAAGSGLEINHDVLEAVELDMDTLTVVRSTSVYVDAADPADPPAPPVDPEPEEPSTPSKAPNKGGSSSGAFPWDKRPAAAPTVEELPFPVVVPPPAADPDSPFQDLVKEEEYVSWAERIDPPQYAVDLYDALVGGSGGPGAGSFTEFLVDDASFQVSPVSAGESGGGYEVLEAETITLSMLEPYSSGGEPENEGLTSLIFTDDDFYSVGVDGRDKTIDYGALKLGDIVKTETFNGVFVTSVPKGDDFDTVKKEVSGYIATVFQAFDKDHPEVFWLSGKCKIRILSVRDSSGAANGCFFLDLADKEGFSMKAPAWTASGTVADGIRRRDSAVERILSAVTGETVPEKLRELNRILTESNEYNTTEDLTTIGNEPHECLSALEGRTGTSGPVCDGYSRAFKVLCDKLGIGCVLETGYAKPTVDSVGTLHMWNVVQVGENWYGTDVTWNDPMVKGVSGAKSGKENERYLLVGAGTEIRGMTFRDSHPVTNRDAKGGVSFTNGPSLSAAAFSAAAYQSGVADLPFTDVDEGAWYYDAVAYVQERGLMNGAGATAFQPQGTITRQQMWMILARLSGVSPADMAEARQWAVSGGVSDGTNPGGAVSRQQMVSLLYRAGGGTSGNGEALAGFPDRGSVAGYALDAFSWAVESGIVAGTSAGTLDPSGTASRAQFAAVLQRYCKAIGRA